MQAHVLARMTRGRDLVFLVLSMVFFHMLLLWFLSPKGLFKTQLKLKFSSIKDKGSIELYIFSYKL